MCSVTSLEQQALTMSSQTINSKWFSRMCDIRTSVLYKSGKADHRDKSYCVDVSDDPQAFLHISTIRSRERTRFFMNKLFCDPSLSKHFLQAVGDGAFSQATELSMSYVSNRYALMAASRLPHLGRLFLHRANIDKEMARLLVLFDRVSYICIKGVRLVGDDDTALALDDSIAFLRLHEVKVDFSLYQDVHVKRRRSEDSSSREKSSETVQKAVKLPKLPVVSKSTKSIASASVSKPTATPTDTNMAAMDVDEEDDLLSLGNEDDTEDEILEEDYPEEGEC